MNNVIIAVKKKSLKKSMSNILKNEQKIHGVFSIIDLCKVQDNKTFQGQPQDLGLCQDHFFF